MTDPNSTAHSPSDDRRPPPHAGVPRCGGVYLHTMGGLALVDPSGERLVPPGHKRKLVLLAVLALADAPVGRDALTAMFWGDDPDRRSARHSLSNALSFLRSLIGRNAITMHRAEILLAPDAVDVDAVELLGAARTRNAARVMALYGGSFLADVPAGGAPALDDWITETRAGITGAMIAAAELRCAAAARDRDWEVCAATARVWLDAAPCAPEPAVYLLTALHSAGTPLARRSALAEYQRLAERLERDHRTLPDSRVTDLGCRLQSSVEADWMNEAAREPAPSGHAPLALEPSVEPRAAAIESSESPVSVTGSRGRRPSRALRRSLSVTGMVACAFAVAALTAHSWLRAETAAARPVIVITDIASTGDTTSSWLDGGLATMLATDLARYSAAEVIEPNRVRDVRRRAELALTGPLSPTQAADLARRVGATLAIRGTLTAAGGEYTLGLVERDVHTGRVVASVNAVASDPIALTDDAVTRLLDSGVADGVPGASSGGALFAEVETPSAEAYQHYVRAEQATVEGRFAEARRELDGAVADDSAFGSALLARRALSAMPADSATVRRLSKALGHARFTAWDVLSQAADAALHNGETARSEQLARSLVAQYPHDPRAYDRLGRVYSGHGRFQEADSVFRRELALDSLGNEAGRGPCVPCSAYSALATLQVFDGHVADAQRTAARWIELQPDLPAPYTALADALSYEGKFDRALEAARRARVLGGNDPVYAGRLVRLLIRTRRYAPADSLIVAWHARGTPAGLRDEADDAAVLLARERGELRASLRALADRPIDAATLFERMDALNRLGEQSAAERLFREDASRVDGSGALTTSDDSTGSRVGDAARAFAWSRAMEADAVAATGDTLRLRAIADSIHDASARSYYGRDWRLHHHVLGRIAMIARRYGDAEREFAAAQWGAAGWTANLAWQARAELAQGKALVAIATLRNAYEGPLDAMGRYEPRSDLDYLMASAFQAAHQADSAAVYGGYVRSAWRGADPEVRRLLVNLR